MNILWFSWKDIAHPLAGGAEVVSSNIRERLVRDGHKVRLITARYKGSQQRETINGVETYRSGDRYSVYQSAKKVYLSEMVGWEDVVIDEMNTLPFLAASYTKTERKILLSYQLARSVWFYQMPFPFSAIGYLLEPLMLRYVGQIYPITATESHSSKKDMERHGLKNVQLFRVGMALAPTPTLLPKDTHSTILVLGAVRPMKRTLHAIKAFEHARAVDPSLRLVIAGDTGSSYAKKVVQYIQNSIHSDAIDVRGRVSAKERLSLMKESSIILVTSTKEGWGLIVTEANSQGTPAITYDVDGLRDSVKDGVTGLLAKNNSPSNMGEKINELLTSPEAYETMRKYAWEWSKEFSFENSYDDFASIIKRTGDLSL